jgi:hypothetical protein
MGIIRKIIKLNFLKNKIYFVYLFPLKFYGCTYNKMVKQSRDSYPLWYCKKSKTSCWIEASFRDYTYRRNHASGHKRRRNTR